MRAAADTHTRQPRRPLPGYMTRNRCLMPPRISSIAYTYTCFRPATYTRAAARAIFAELPVLVRLHRHPPSRERRTCRRASSCATRRLPSTSNAVNWQLSLTDSILYNERGKICTLRVSALASVLCRARVDFRRRFTRTEQSIVARTFLFFLRANLAALTPMNDAS